METKGHKPVHGGLTEFGRVSPNIHVLYVQIPSLEFMLCFDIWKVNAVTFTKALFKDGLISFQMNTFHQSSASLLQRINLSKWNSDTYQNESKYYRLDSVSAQLLKKAILPSL